MGQVRLIKGSFMFQEKKLIDLLPYEPRVKIFEKELEKRILSLIALILQELIESIQDFYLKNKFTAFDPHVGESLCQIRACKLLDIYFESGVSTAVIAEQKEFVTQLQSLLSKTRNLLDQNHDEVLDWDTTVASYLNKHQLNILISHDLFFLMISRFLTKFRKINELENTMIDYSKLISSWKVSKNICRRIIHQYQKHLSRYSYEYIERKASQTQVIDSEFLRKLKQEDDDARCTLPCYLVTKVLLADLKEKNANMLFVVRNEHTLKLTTLFFKYNNIEEKFISCSAPTSDDLKQPCFVLHGISTSNATEEEYKIIFNKIGVEKIIGLDSASHPQHSGKKLAHLKANPFLPIIADIDEKISRLAMNNEAQFLSLKERSEQLGCNRLNYELIFIRHIFCDRLDSQLEYVQQRYFYSTMPQAPEFV